MSMTLEEQAAGYKRLLDVWKRDARHYEAGLMSIRKHAQLNGLPKIAAMVSEIMSFENQCNAEPMQRCVNPDCSCHFLVPRREDF